jgi:hypothetical protein
MTILDHGGFLPSILLVAGFAVFLRAVRSSLWQVALFSLPGTVAHELSHFLVGAVTLAQPQRVSLWPRRSAGRWILGFVTFRNLNVLNGAFVALAPLLLLPVAFILFSQVLLPLWVERQWLWWAIGGYVTATFVLAALPSFQDIAMGARSILFYLVLVVALLFALHYLR